MSTLKIIDVSKFDSVTKWSKVATVVDGVIIRAGYRGTKGGIITDSKFKSHINGAIEANIPRIGVYWWTAHTSEAQAKEEADYLLRLLKPYGDHINFGVWLDSESSPGASSFNKLSSYARTACALAFLNVVKNAGYQAGVYASDSWFSEKLIMSKLTEYPKWVAKYSSTQPKIVKEYAAWQYTEKGTCQGVRGDVDMSYFYVDFANSSVPEQPVEQKNKQTPMKDTPYSVGRTYILQANMYVRTGPGATYSTKHIGDMTADGRRHCASGMDVAILLSGTRVTCKKIEVLSSGAVWMKIPSGWVCAIGSTGKVYVK